MVYSSDRLVLGTDFPYENGAVFERAASYITTSGLVVLC
jgi:6-methylsalicylate decarboxylase